MTEEQRSEERNEELSEEHGEEEKEEETQEEGTQEEKPAEPYKAFSSKKEHDDYLEGVLKERLERKDRKAQEDKEKAERKAREEALKEQGKFKEIAEQHEATIADKDQRIQELEGVASERDALQDRLESQEKLLKDMVKPGLERVPEMFRGLVEEKTVEEQAEWLKNNAEKLTGDSGPIGSPASPRASQNNNRGQQDKEVEAAERQRASRAV